MKKLLHTQAEVLKRLKKKGIVTFSKVAFSQAVTRGVIPHIIESGVKHKLYDYESVVKAIKKSGIGSPISTKEHIDKLPDPKEGQTQDEYVDEVSKLGTKPTLVDANIYKTLYSGKLEKLKYEREIGLVVSRAEVEDKAFSVTRAIRDKILTIPERLSNELASINDPHQVKELLFKEFGLMLEGFSEDSFLWY